MPTDRSALAELIAADVAVLCAGADRQPGTQRNRDASRYIAEQLRRAGARVSVLPFTVPEWRPVGATLEVAGVLYRLHVGPYSPACRQTTHLAVASSADALEALGEETRGGVLLLHGEIAEQQLTPRAYPWYSNPAHAAIYDTIERLEPAAVIAATGKNPAMTAARDPFPLIEDPAFGIPTAFCGLAEGDALLTHAGDIVHLEIESTTVPSTGDQPVGVLGSDDQPRVIVAGHMDSTWESPGAIDNAAGAATVLAMARLLAESPASCRVELVCFNGEDHATSPGEVVYLAANGAGFSDVSLMINVDGAGFSGSPAAVSLYGVSDSLEQLVDRTLEGFSQIERGPEWFASDHAIFAMRGVPALAVTSRDFNDIWEAVAHTAHDVPDNLDYELIAEVATALTAVVRGAERP